MIQQELFTPARVIVKITLTDVTGFEYYATQNILCLKRKQGLIYDKKVALTTGITLFLSVHTANALENVQTSRIEQLSSLTINTKTVEKAIKKGDYTYLFKLYNNIESEQSVLSYLSQSVKNSEIINAHLEDEQDQLIDVITQTLQQKTQNYLGNKKTVVG